MNKLLTAVGFAASVAAIYVQRRAARNRARHIRKLRCAIATAQGGRQHMEDVAAWSLHPRHGVAIGTVADGHGGRAAADFVCSQLPSTFINQRRARQEPARAIEAAFKKLDDTFEDNVQKGVLSPSGSTVVSGLFLKDKLVVAGVGDCRAVLSRRGRAAELTTEHSATASPGEKDRVLSAGAYLDSEGYVNGELAVTRSIGDGHHTAIKKRDGSGAIIPTPEVTSTPLEKHEEFVIFASDGVWMRSQTLVDIVRSNLRQHNCPQRAADAVVEAATNSDFGKDNVAVLIVCFGHDPPPSLAPRRKSRSRLFRQQ